MARVVLTADYTLMTNFRDLPLATFFSCIPTDFWQSRFAFRVLAPSPPHNGGEAVYAPYGLRKLEAALLRTFRPEEIVVAHPFHVNSFIGPETEVVGIHTMDPLGLGPVSMSFTNGGVLTPYTRACFEDLCLNLPNGGRRFKLVVGGAGVWQFDYRPEEKERLGIDNLVAGEVDHIAGEIFLDIIDGTAPERIPEPLNPPRLEEIPPIRAPSMHGMIEVMRGCGRGCQFCEVTLRRLRYFSPEFVQREASINARAGLTNAWLHSDDIFLYKVEDYKTMQPNSDAIKEIFQAAMDVRGIETGNPTHGTLASVCADPQLIADLTKILKGGPDNWTGIQSGLETGSVSLVEKIMPRKLLPYKPSEWPEVVLESIRILNDNYWFPALTAIIGLPGENPEDAYDTCVLLDRMEKVSDNPHFIVAPLSFVPIGVLKGEEFYRVDEMLDEARFNIVYRCWKHILKEIDETLWGLSRIPFPVKAVINAIGRMGGRHILGILERFGERRGFRVWPPLA
jgi:radical SAM superfamily enzyme YgiQ (UPF0313 family)